MYYGKLKESSKRIVSILVAFILLVSPLYTLESFAEDGSNNDAGGKISIKDCTVELEYYLCTYDGTEMEPTVTVTSKDGGTKLVQDTDYAVTYGANTEPGWVSVTVDGIGSYSGEVTTYFEIKKLSDQQADRFFEGKSRDRLAGKNRYDTSITVANALKRTLGVQKFENIVVAYGGNFPDALAGGYLAKVKNAPVVMVDKANETRVREYIEANIEEGGTIYILGGEGVVSKSFEEALSDSDVASINVERLDGTDRYETNLKILKAAGVEKEALLVCSGNGYADSLSASAVGLPILLVGSTLRDDQKEFLESIVSDHAYIIGGTGAVKSQVDSAIKTVKSSEGIERSTKRLFGATRYETSTAVARQFFEEENHNVVLVYGQNYPDGLSAGPLANAIGAPLILAANNSTAAAKAYVGTTWIDRCVTIGGPKLISDSSVKSILN